MYIPPQDYVFIADESGISHDRFIVVGGICIHRDDMLPAYATLSAFRAANNMRAELKWTKVSDKKLSAYIELTDQFFLMNRTGLLSFHCLIFDSHQWNHRKYNRGDKDVGLSKLYFQLLLHKFVKHYGKKGSLFIKLDHRNSSTSLDAVRRMLNALAARDHGILGSPVKQVVSDDSRNCDLLQMSDVILGAVCAARNGRDLVEGGRMAKKVLAQRVVRESGLRSFAVDSEWNESRFTVWNMTPKSG